MIMVNNNKIKNSLGPKAIYRNSLNKNPGRNVFALGLSIILINIKGANNSTQRCYFKKEPVFVQLKFKEQSSRESF